MGRKGRTPLIAAGGVARGVAASNDAVGPPAHGVSAVRGVLRLASAMLSRVIRVARSSIVVG